MEAKIFDINKKEVNDYILIAQLQKGSERAFNIIYGKYYMKVLNKLKKDNKLIKEYAQDFVIDAFIDLKIQVEDGRYKEKGRLFNYIYTIAHRAFLKSINKNKENITEDDYLKNLVEDIFPDNTEKENLFRLVEDALKNVTLGRKEKKINCNDLLFSKYGITKISDKELFEENPGIFTTVSDVKNKRNKCIKKIKKYLGLD